MNAIATPPPGRRRRLRWFQLSFRTFLLLIVALCVWLGIRVEHARRQKEIVRRISSNSRNGVTYAHEIAADGTRTSGVAPPGPAWLRKLTGDHFFIQPRMVSLIEYNDDLLQDAIKLQGVEIVNLAGANDEQLRTLQAFPHLRMLDASSTFITKRGLAHVARYRELEHLAISGAWITDEDLRILKPLRNLKFLTVGISQVTAEGIAWVKQTWPQIQVTPADFPSSPQEIAALKEFTGINARFEAGPEGNVLVVHLFGKQTNDEHLLRLASLPELLVVYLYDTSVTASGVAELSNRTPRITVRPNLREPLPEEAAAAEQLTAAGFKIELDDDGFISRVESASETLTDEAFAPLVDLPRLTVVNCDSTLFTDGALRYLSNATRVRSLLLPNAELSDAGLIHLQHLDRLTYLTLSGAAITDQGLVALSGMTQLQVLTLPGVTLRGDGLNHLQGCTKLERLDLTGSSISDTALAHLSPANLVSQLTLNDTTITDDGLACLRKWPALRVIVLRNTRITDNGLLQLRAIAALGFVDVRNTAVTSAGADALHEALPNCRVTR